MKGSHALIIAGASLALGFAVGMRFAGSEETTPNAPVPARNLVDSKSAAAYQPPALPSESVAPLERLRQLLTAGNGRELAECGLAIRGLTLEQCREARRLVDVASPDDREYLLRILASHWARLDAPAAFEAALRERDNDFRNRLGQAAGRELARSDPDFALQKLSEAKGQEAIHRVANWVILPLAKTDPIRAAEFLSGCRGLKQHAGYFAEVAREYAKSNPDAALAWADALEPRRVREEAVKHAWSGWAERDPQAVAAKLQERPAAKEFSEVYDSVSRAWSRKDPAAAFAWIEGLADKENRERAFQGFEIDWRALGMDKSSALIEASKVEDFKANLASRVAQQIANEDPAAALDWAESLSPGKARDTALQPVIQEMAGRDPAGAAKYAVALPESSQRAEILRNTVSRWAEIEPDEAIAFVEALPPGKERDRAMGAAIQGVQGDDPAKALEWLAKIQDPKTVRDAAPGLIEALQETDRPAAIALASRLPPEVQPDAYHNLVRGWAQEETKESGDWINALPQGPARDSAVKAYVSVIDELDPARATEWSRSIQKPEDRAEAFISAFDRWRRLDEQAANEWLQQNQLPDDEFRPVIEMILRKAAEEQDDESE